MDKLVDKVTDLVKRREFISVATCDLERKPNSAPKFILKQENNHIYLVDYTIGRTWNNLGVNPRASLSFMDTRSLNGYQINGSVELIENGEEYELISDEMLQKQIRLTAQHIIEEIRGLEKHDSFEAAIAEKVVFFKVKIEEVVEIGHRGRLIRKKVKSK